VSRRRIYDILLLNSEFANTGSSSKFVGLNVVQAHLCSNSVQIKRAQPTLLQAYCCEFYISGDCVPGNDAYCCFTALGDFVNSQKCVAVTNDFIIAIVRLNDPPQICIMSPIQEQSFVVHCITL
jgi:hypothetical protein